MDLRKFEHLIAHLETEAHIDPRAYNTRVALLAAVGYSYVFLVLGGLLTLVYQITFGRFSFLLLQLLPLQVYAGLLFGLLTLAVFVLRGMAVKIEPPEGIEIKRSEAPELFRLLERIRLRLQGPSIHRVVLVDEMRAAIMQIPRLGLLGWHRNHLVIGMPLLQSVGVTQATAVLAHEYGHLAGSHGAFASWIYRLRRTWLNIMIELHKADHKGRYLFTWFYDRYVPYFLAYTFVLARSNEYDADRASAKVAGAAQAAGALVLVNIRGDFILNRFWPGYLGQADHHPEPPALPHAYMRAALKAGRDAEDEKRRLKYALARGTDLDDTHPSLTDRLAGMRQAPVIPEEAGPSAAEALFGARLPRYLGLLDAQWKLDHIHDWHQHHDQAQRDRARLSMLDGRAARGEELDVEEMHERAALTERFSGAAYALPLYRAVLEKEARMPEAHLALGRLLTERGELDAVRHLEAAIQGNAAYTAQAGWLAYRALAQQGRRTEADRYMHKAMQAQEARKEREEQGGREPQEEGAVESGVSYAEKRARRAAKKNAKKAASAA